MNHEERRWGSLFMEKCHQLARPPGPAAAGTVLSNPSSALSDTEWCASPREDRKSVGALGVPPRWLINLWKPHVFSSVKSIKKKKRFPCKFVRRIK